jgi:hypothetical protein
VGENLKVLIVSSMSRFCNSGISLSLRAWIRFGAAIAGEAHSAPLEEFLNMLSHSLITPTLVTGDMQS